MNLRFIAACALLACAGSGFSSTASSRSGSRKPNACIECHQNLAGRLSGVIEEWKKSVHFKNNVGCHNCHGGDPTVRRLPSMTEDQYKELSHQRQDFLLFGAESRGNTFIATARGRAVSYFCGKCHDLIKEKHLGSPHGELGQPTCLYCHGGGSHAIGEASLNIIDVRGKSEKGRCSPCHLEGTMEAVRSIKKTLINVEKELKKASEEYAWLTSQGYRNLELERLFQHSKETRSHLRQTFHSFNMREITNFASAITSNADITHQAYKLIKRLKDAKRTQAFIGLGIMVFLLCFAALLLYYKKTVLAAQ